MNGWQRLGVVVAAPIVLLSAAIGYDQDKKIYVYDAKPTAETARLKGDAFFQQLFFEQREKPNSLTACDLKSVTITPNLPPDTFTIQCARNADDRLFNASFWGGIAAAILYAIYAIFLWVYRGFRPKT